MRKCEWKDGKLERCETARRAIFSVNIPPSFCPFCGASLEKPVRLQEGFNKDGTPKEKTND